MVRLDERTKGSGMKDTVRMTAEECVGKAALWYDERFPGWHNVVDLDLLDMRSAASCVAGQVIPWAGFPDGYDALDSLNAPPEVHSACVSPQPLTASYEVVTDAVDNDGYINSRHAAWRSEVEFRRSQEAS